MPPGFRFINSSFRPHIYLCSLWFLQKTASALLNNITCLFFVMGELALCEVETELLNVQNIPVMVPLSKAAWSHPSGHPGAAAVLRYAIKGMTSA
jgi:hypothetical protein